MELVKKKIKAGQTKTVTPLESVENASSTAKIYDLTEMLQQSLRRGVKVVKPTEKAEAKPAKKGAAAGARAATLKNKTAVAPTLKASARRSRKAA